ncbi:hypothetical protein WICMUC_003656 [Wickerhamomyces mucosus]|uniref:Protein kinase domain-containing protein n=1 Tax=Wickerhamomyces mucosus TaxID=1378264 RepID=A0A9P8TCC7_9ASCO|nr:hypothetical protein WICMUC_003656 [Wickerhamomyces mucosus]
MNMFKWKTGIQAAYSIASNPSFHSELWAVYPARHKSSDKQVSVFIFDKKKFESLLNKNGIIKRGDKNLINDAYEVLRSQVSNLAKFRHPNILTIIEPLEEHKSSFIFVTEYLTNCLNSVDSLDDVLIQKGLLQTCNALNFLHKQAKFIHLSIQPSSIFINDNSDWKLGGLGHIQPLELDEYFIKQYDPRIPNFININLNFTAPEVILDSKITPESDIYSLGAIIYFLYNKASFINCNNSTTYYKEDYSKFENLIRTNNPRQVLRNIPESLFSIFRSLIDRSPNQRLPIDDFIQSEFFNNPLIKAMIFLDEFPTKTDDEKLIFLKNLPNLLQLFPQSILSQKFLPILLDIINKRIVPLIQVSLGLIFIIGENLSQLTFHDKIFDNLNNDLVNFEEAQIVILENLKLLQTKVKLEEFKKFLIKLLEKTLDLKSNFAIQSKTLERIDVILQSVDFPTVKNNIFPKICTIFSKTTSLNVKVKTIEALHELIEQKGIDKFIVNDTLLPLLKSMKTREIKILEAILKIYKSSANILDEESVVVNIIPQIWLLSISSTLSTKVYGDYVQAINDISSRLQKSRLDKLKSLEGERIDNNEDDKEKFRHLLYGKEDNGDVPQAEKINNAVLTPQTRSQPTVEQHPQSQVYQSKSRDQQPKIQRLVLKPQNKSAELNFGSQTQNEIPNAVKSLRLNKSINGDFDDDFNDFVSASSSRVTSPSLKKSDSQSPSQFPSQSTSSIDWSSEANKIGGFGVLQPQKSNYPPGFTGNVIQPVRNSFSSSSQPNSFNKTNNINGFDYNNDSLI